MTPVPPDLTDAALERQRWEAEFRLREREIILKEQGAAQESALKARELDAKLADQKWARWTNPLVLAVFAATLAALGNAWLAYLNGEAQRTLELTRSKAQVELERERAQGQQAVEEAKAEAARILEVIKTADPEKAAVNLDFLLKAGLIDNKTRRQALESFLKERQPGEGPSIPPTATPAQLIHPNYNLAVPVDNPSQTKAATKLLALAVGEINRNVDVEVAAERILQYLRSTSFAISATEIRFVPWHAAFLSWLIRESGNKDNLPMSAAGVAIWNDAFRKKLTFLPNEKPVLPGDIAIFLRGGRPENMDDLRAGKIPFVPTGSGIVYSSNVDEFSTIEGTGSAVRLRDHSVSEKIIIGFIRLSDG